MGISEKAGVIFWSLVAKLKIIKTHMETQTVSIKIQFYLLHFQKL